MGKLEQMLETLRRREDVILKYTPHSINPSFPKLISIGLRRIHMEDILVEDIIEMEEIFKARMRIEKEEKIRPATEEEEIQLSVRLWEEAERFIKERRKNAPIFSLKEIAEDLVKQAEEKKEELREKDPEIEDHIKILKNFEEPVEIDSRTHSRFTDYFAPLRSAIEILRALLFVRLLEMPTDLGSEALMLVPLISQKNIKKTKRLVRVNDIEIIVENKEISFSNIENFLNSLSSRLGDTYAYLFHKASTSGSSINGTKVIEITAKEIAEVLYKTPNKRNKRRVSEALKQLFDLTIQIPLSVFNEDIRKRLEVSKKERYLYIKPFTIVAGFTEEANPPRINRAIITIHPLLWKLYYDLGMRIPVPLPVLQLDPTHPPSKWGKIISWTLYNHARRNRKRRQLKIKVHTVLRRTGIIDEIEKMKKNKHHKRAFEYLQKAFNYVSYKGKLSFQIIPEPTQLDELINATIIYTNPSFPHK